MELFNLNDVAFEEKIYDQGERCLIVFSRKNCHVCAEVVPMVEEISAGYQNKFGFYKVDVEEQRDLFNRFSLRGVPTIMFFTDGEYRGKLTGLVEEETVVGKIEEML